MLFYSYVGRIMFLSTLLHPFNSRALADKANDAFYKPSNTRSQIQAYVFDGMGLVSETSEFWRQLVVVCL